MEYAIEFICRIDDKAEELALGFAWLVGGGVAGIVAEAEALYRSFDTVPRPMDSVSATPPARSFMSFTSESMPKGRRTDPRV
jgi:hypothetical protein